ncbi:MAG: nicotinate (nicotinamide) nucleotide adenylyltransferase, partial [Planctomycetales bacterium]|nr:nicotinate (nicotinamide) nucleotide adenylyltransferase [Planctomycetales bacterium]
GHLLLAETCREACQLDRVLFVPAAVSPHKQDQEPASGPQRLQMLKLAIAGHDAFDVSSLEVDRGGVSYTVQTLELLHTETPADWFLLMGADSLVEFPRWRNPQRICELATPIVVQRFGSPDPDFSPLRDLLPASRWEGAHMMVVAMPRIEISSSDLRARVARGASIRFQTPRAVEEFIRQHRLYQQHHLSQLPGQTQTGS